MTRQLVILSVICAMLAGCVTQPPQTKDHADIAGLLAQWKEAFVARDINRLMSLYSENYAANGRNKAAETEALKAEFKGGIEPDALIIVEYATITVDGAKADVAPISISGKTGSASMRLTLAKEDGRWLVVKMADK
ncbi:MAG: hypothetical protein HZB26_01390 [Candidatus Hydrogenedentes bacterium]|nr:hypothetical protein [Candidatus Hydrogenedentota bacterium]